MPYPQDKPLFRLELNPQNTRQALLGAIAAAPVGGISLPTLQNLVCEPGIPPSKVEALLNGWRKQRLITFDAEWHVYLPAPKLEKDMLRWRTKRADGTRLPTNQTGEAVRLYMTTGLSLSDIGGHVGWSRDTTRARIINQVGRHAYDERSRHRRSGQR